MITKLVVYASVVTFLPTTDTPKTFTTMDNIWFDAIGSAEITTLLISQTKTSLGAILSLLPDVLLTILLLSGVQTMTMFTPIKSSNGSTLLAMKFNKTVT